MHVEEAAVFLTKKINLCFSVVRWNFGIRSYRCLYMVALCQSIEHEMQVIHGSTVCVERLGTNEDPRRR